MSAYPLLRWLGFRLPPELAHGLGLRALGWLGRAPGRRRWLARRMGPPVEDPIELWGLRFRNRVGLAAGYDKDAVGWRGLAQLGFGHLELGTVTPRPQSGNPRPRVVRLGAEQGLINRLGFPSGGAEAFRAHLPEAGRAEVILGVNLGKQKETPLAAALEDYAYLIRELGSRADYLAVNISSPNTPELRQLQSEAYLEDLAVGLRAELDGLEGADRRRTPLLVKLAPDLTPHELDRAVDVLVDSGIDGIIATNTTISREGVASGRASEAGGLSGAPLERLATDRVGRIAKRLAGRAPLIAVGGVVSEAGARRKIEAGASLVQLYTGLVYRGPRLVAEAARGARAGAAARA